MFEKKKHICSYEKRGLNKLQVLNYAQEIGLKVPKTYITGSKAILEDIRKNKCQELITKNIYEAFLITQYKSNTNIYSKTYEVNDDLLNPSSEKFLYSLFQEKIKKHFEVRTFYLNEIFYSAAILSQDNEKTKIDFRNYDLEMPNRIIPFSIPKELEILLKKLFNKVNLNTGSVDLIYSDGEYVFLEINPVGQFSFISDACNYNIENNIANFLSN